MVSGCHLNFGSVASLQRILQLECFRKLTGIYQVHLKRSRGLGEGVVGYGLHLTPSELGPKIVQVISGGEAERTGLISIGVSLANPIATLILSDTFSLAGYYSFCQWFTD
jgi:hypothetical protein